MRNYLLVPYGGSAGSSSVEGNAVLAPWMASSSRGNAAPAAGPDSALDPRDRLEARLRAAEAERRDLEAEVVAIQARLARLRAEIAEDKWARLVPELLARGAEAARRSPVLQWWRGARPEVARAILFRHAREADAAEEEAEEAFEKEAAEKAAEEVQGSSTMAAENGAQGSSMELSGTRHEF